MPSSVAEEVQKSLHKETTQDLSYENFNLLKYGRGEIRGWNLMHSEQETRSAINTEI